MKSAIPSVNVCTYAIYKTALSSELISFFQIDTIHWYFVVDVAAAFNIVLSQKLMSRKISLFKDIEIASLF